MNVPVDQEIRTLVTTALDRAFALGAGAGTGKTRSLVERAVNLLGEGIPPSAIALVTFTEAATQEVKHRIRDGLEAALADATPERKRNLRAAVRSFDDLTVVTLHAFARELLAREALEAGWAPGTELMAGMLADAAVEQAYSDWYRALCQEEPDQIFALSAYASPRDLKSAALEILKFQDLEPVLGPEEVDWASPAGQVRLLIRQVKDAASACTNGGCTLLAKHTELLDRFSAALEQSDEELVRGLREAPVSDLRGGRKGDWPDDTRDRFVAGIRAFKEWQKEAGRAETGPIHRWILERMRTQLVPAVEESKRLVAKASFDDLLFGCVRLLRDSPEARRRLGACFQHLLIDEVQDTDPMQAEIVARLMDPSGDAEHWSDLTAPSQGLFAVGDPKQSIYRFRRADVTTWTSLRTWMQQAAEARDLQQCFRSVPGIVHLVNYVFRDLPDFTPLAPYREKAELDPVVVLDTEDDTEAFILHLEDLLEQKAQVVDRQTKALRPLRFGDVMVLLPSWSKANEVQDRLTAAGIPSLVEGGRSFFQRDEVRLSLALLRAVDEPADHEAVVFCLRGLFGFSLEELARHVALGGRWTPTGKNPPESPCSQALDVLGRLHAERGSRSLVSILDQVLAHTRAPAVWRLRPNGLGALANLDKLRELIRELELVTTTPAQVLEELTNMAFRGGSEEDLPAREPDADAVRITSVFKAKGREAPVVALLHANRKRDGTRAIIDRSNSTVAVRVGDLYPPGWKTLEEQEKQEVEEERRRWMYVAATRARDQLVLCLSDGRSKKSVELLPSELTIPLGKLADRGHDEQVIIAEGAVVRIRKSDQLTSSELADETFPGFDETVDAYLASPPELRDSSGDAFGARRRASLEKAKAASTKWATVTSLARPRRRGGTGIGQRAGTVVHRVMESLDLHNSREALDEEIMPLLSVYGPLHGLSPDEMEQAADVIRKLLQHAVMDDVRKASEHWKEVPFAFPHAKRKNLMVTGTIDLCFPLDAGRTQWMVVDWKTDSPPAGDPLREDYQRQLHYYAEALIRTLTGLDVSVTTCLAGPPPELVDDLREVALDEVHPGLRSGLEQLLGAGAPVPIVGQEVGDPVVTTAELWFPKQQVALLLDRTPEQLEALSGQSLTVRSFERAAPGWGSEASEWLADTLSVSLPEQTDEETEVE